MLRSILIHMRLTDPSELDAAASKAGVHADPNLPGGKGRTTATTTRGRRRRRAGSAREATTAAGGKQPPNPRRHFWLPLTEERVDFLLGLTDPVVKVV